MKGLLLSLALIAAAAALWLLSRSGEREQTTLAPRPSSTPASTPAGEPTLEASEAGARLALDSAPRASTASPVSAAESPARGVPLRGSLVDAAGERLVRPRAQLELSAQDGRELSLSARDGAFELAELPFGAWTVRASLPGYRRVTRELVSSPSSGPLEVLLVLEKKPGVRVVLLQPGGEAFEPLETSGFGDEWALWAAATREAPQDVLPALLARYHEGECGRFVAAARAGLREPVLGLIELDCDPPLWVSLAQGLLPLETRRLEPGEEELVFTLAPESLAAREAGLSFELVAAESGAPLAGATLALEELGSGTQAWFESGDGRFVLEGLQPGPLRLELGGPRRVSEMRELFLAPGVVRDLGRIALARSELATLVLEVELPPDATHGFVRCEPARALRGGWKSSEVVGERLAEGGEHSLELACGSWIAWVEAQLGERRLLSPRREIALEPQGARARFALAPAVRVELRAEAGRRLIALVDEAKIPYVDAAVVDEEEGIELDLPPGEYHLRVVDGDGTTRSIAFVAAGVEHEQRVP